MKQRILFLLTVLFMAAPSFARGELNVLSGDLSVFKDPDVTATVVFDYSNLEIEGKQWEKWLKEHGDDYVRDWPDQTVACEEYFIKCWNHDNDEGMQVSSSKGKAYTMYFVVNEMNMGSGAASMLIGFGAGGAKMSGMMYVFKGNSDVPVLTVEIDGQTGRSSMTETGRRLDLYGELAEDLVKTLKKTKANKISEATEAVKIAGRQAATAATKVVSAASQTAKAAATSAKTAATATAKSVASTAKSTATSAAKATTGAVKKGTGAVKKGVSNARRATTAKSAGPAKKPAANAKTADEEEEEVAPVKKNVSAARDYDDDEDSQATAAEKKRIAMLKKIHTQKFERRRKPVRGDFETVAGERKIGVFIDFSEADIDGNTEEDFITYMKTSADKRDKDRNFDKTWEEEVKPGLVSLFNSIVNKELKDEKQKLRLSSDITTDIVLKLDVLEMDDNGNNKINYIFVDMQTGKEIAACYAESDGGHFGRFVGLMEQGMESAGEDFAELLLDQID